ncbi:MAG: transglycosylase domain-containing protein, partial [Chloroflexota bacterium]
MRRRALTRERRLHRLRIATETGGRSSLILGVALFLGLLGMVVLVTPVAMAAAGVLWASNALSSLTFQSHQATFQTSRIYDRNGKLLYQFVDPRAGLRTQVPLSKIPESLRDATIAIEDRSFYTNPGFSVQGVIRAAYEDVTAHRIVGGGSTITQQLVKTIYLTPQVTFQRKLRELAISYVLTKEKSKDQILELYLNQIYYGNDAYGIEAAAESYFGKTAMHLDLAESAMLAGLPQSPSAYDPIHNFKAAKARQLEVLDNMVNQGYITDRQAAGAY